MPKGGEPTISTRTVDIDEQTAAAHQGVAGRYVVAGVIDTGIGMDEETMKRAFEPFFTTKERGKGTGLGLPSVYGTARSHGGWVELFSQVGMGTTVEVYLPLATGDLTAEPAQPTRPAAGAGTALVIDDDESIRDVCQDTLRAIGYSVNAFGGGSEAVEFYRKNHASVDVVLLDMVMPGMGGRECLRELRRVNRGARVVLMSGYAVDGEVEAALSEGAAAFVPKPFKTAKLAEAIAEVCRT